MPGTVQQGLLSPAVSCRGFPAEQPHSLTALKTRALHYSENLSAGTVMLEVDRERREEEEEEEMDNSFQV